jgi:hypothetical protein
MTRAICGVGRVIFQFEFGELLEVDGVLIVPRLRVNLPSVSALGDAGCAIFLKGGNVFIYREGAYPVEPQLIGDRVDSLYIVQGQPTTRDALDEEHKSTETIVGPRIQYQYLREERESLLSTYRRLNWCEWT